VAQSEALRHTEWHFTIWIPPQRLFSFWKP